MKNLLCLSTNQSEHAPDYTIAGLFKNCLIHRACIVHISNMKLKPLTQTAPFNFTQKIVISLIKAKQEAPLTHHQAIIISLIKFRKLSVKERDQILALLFSKQQQRQQQ